MKKKQKKAFKEMKSFEAHLQKKSGSDKTINQHIDNVRYFNAWLLNKNMGNIIQVTTDIILSYVKSLSVKTGTINTRLNSLRKYYDFLMKQDYIRRNPAATVFIGRKQIKVVQAPLDAESLNELYLNFDAFLDAKPIPNNFKPEFIITAQLRFKVLVSLMIYQGLDAGEIRNLHVSDIDLTKHTINISPKSRRKGRALKLEAPQMILLNNYIKSLPPSQERVLDFNINNAIHYVLRILKGIEPRVINAAHIRKSRIMVVVSTNKLREAQTLIGHKFTTSTLSYWEQDTTELVDEINRVHVFRQ